MQRNYLLDLIRVENISIYLFITLIIRNICIFSRFNDTGYFDISFNTLHSLILKVIIRLNRYYVKLASPSIKNNKISIHNLIAHCLHITENKN